MIEASESFPAVYVQGTGSEPNAFDKDMTEPEIAWVVDEWLQSQCWETYPEVVLDTFPGRPDLIAERRGICQVIECKRSFSLGVVEQAARWRTYSRPEQSGMPHLIWVACRRANYRPNELLWWLVREFGIGIMEIDKQPAVELRDGNEVEKNPQRYTIYRRRSPRIQPGSRRTAKTLMRQLNPDMRIAQPGSKGGDTQYMTPFKRTMAMVDAFLRAAPDTERHIEHIIEHLNENGGHHYGSDRSAMSAIPPQLDRLGYPRTREWGCWFRSKA
ncbi:hypothetical protein FGL86_05715 [Pistricoccus aurantiacus]|uniref:Uncharacterized protein n=1 Tax=Pistricoccus aurantiacus TaxID=1883414 RepID=A0A5B8SQX1_9GAMM|nr:hypothetical protein [Pistricoccus aurantiacus]QEA38624.1 hypothetical protein FGL86_05715 [Pistricoccus aurantiacus]